MPVLTSISPGDHGEQRCVIDDEYIVAVRAGDASQRQRRWILARVHRLADRLCDTAAAPAQLPERENGPAPAP